MQIFYAMKSTYWWWRNRCSNACLLTQWQPHHNRIDCPPVDYALLRCWRSKGPCSNVMCGDNECQCKRWRDDSIRQVDAKQKNSHHCHKTNVDVVFSNGLSMIV